MVLLPLIRDAFANRGVKLSIIEEALGQHVEDVTVVVNSIDPMSAPLDYLEASDYLEIVQRFVNEMGKQGFA